MVLGWFEEVGALQPYSYNILAEMERRAERMERTVPDNDNSTGLRRAWRRMRRVLFESSDITRPPPPDKPPKP